MRELFIEELELVHGGESQTNSRPGRATTLALGEEGDTHCWPGDARLECLPKS